MCICVCVYAYTIWPKVCCHLTDTRGGTRLSHWKYTGTTFTPCMFFSPLVFKDMTHLNLSGYLKLSNQCRRLWQSKLLANRGDISEYGWETLEFFIYLFFSRYFFYLFNIPDILTWVQRRWWCIYLFINWKKKQKTKKTPQRQDVMTSTRGAERVTKHKHSAIATRLVDKALEDINILIT